MKGRLVKWDAAIVGESPPLDVDPIGHPGVIEVIDLNEGQNPQTIYRRQDNGTDDLGRTVSR
jgi:hypothetical protein